MPTFPRARYLVQRGEWEDAHHATERNRASYLEHFFAAAEKQTEFLDGDAEIVPGVRVEVGFGAHASICNVCGWNPKATRHTSLGPGPHNRPSPYPWMTSFDLYPLETLANKKRFLPEAGWGQSSGGFHP